MGGFQEESPALFEWSAQRSWQPQVSHQPGAHPHAGPAHPPAMGEAQRSAAILTCLSHPPSTSNRPTIHPPRAHPRWARRWRCCLPGRTRCGWAALQTSAAAPPPRAACQSAQRAGAVCSRRRWAATLECRHQAAGGAGPKPKRRPGHPRQACTPPATCALRPSSSAAPGAPAGWRPAACTTP